MLEKIAVVTGANKGIGYAIAKGLCQKYDGTVYLTSRDSKKGETAVAELKKLNLNPKFHQLDITDQSSIDKFKTHIEKTHGGIDLLVNNAAIAFIPGPETPEQSEKTIRVNYFATLKLCESLFPLLRKNARVVNLSSSAGRLARIPSADIRAKFSNPSLTIEDLNKLVEEYIKAVKNGASITTGWGASDHNGYVVSKVAVSALTMVQQKNFDKEKPNRNISVNSVHPGYVNTDINSHSGHLTAEQGARAPLYLCLGNHSLKGKYVWCDSQVIDWASTTLPADCKD